MALLQSSCLLSSYHQHHHLCCVSIRPIKNVRMDSPSKTSYKGCIITELIGQAVIAKEKGISLSWSFLGASKARYSPSFRGTNIRWRRKSPAIYSSWISNAEIASKAFTLGTAAVLPFYTFMIVVPQAQMTKKLAESYIPYVLLAILYAYLLYLSWTPDTFHLMFASKHWLPELTGIASLFSSKMTLASAWIHLLAVDLFAARQVYHEGLKDNIQTRHSISLCLFFCPIGILAHSITKAMTRLKRERLNCH